MLKHRRLKTENTPVPQPAIPPMIPPEGIIIEGLSMEGYQNHSALSRSGIVDLLQSPSKYWYGQHAKDTAPVSTSNHFELGSLVSDWLTMGAEYVIKHYMVKLQGNAETQSELSAGKVLVSQNTWDEALELAASVWLNTLAKELLSHKDNIPEASMFFQLDADFENPDSKVWCKARPDILNKNKRLFLDIKTISDISRWPDHVLDMGYNIQNVFYQYGYQSITGCSDEELNQFEFYFIVIDKSTRVTEVITLDDWFLHKGLHDLNMALNTYYTCQQNNNWHTILKTPQPKWARGN